MTKLKIENDNGTLIVTKGKRVTAYPGYSYDEVMEKEKNPKD